MTPFSEDIYEEEQYTAPLGIIALAGAQELAKGIITIKAYAHQEEGVDLDTAVENAYTFFIQ